MEVPAEFRVCSVDLCLAKGTGNDDGGSGGGGGGGESEESLSMGTVYKHDLSRLANAMGV